MSCGCGGKGGLPLAVQARLEIARLTLSATGTTVAHDGPGFEAAVERVRKFVIGDVDLDAAASPSTPVAIGTDADAVTSRNAFVNGSLRHTIVPPIIAAKLLVAGVHTLGQLVQWKIEDLSRAGIDAPGRKAASEAIGKYGLALGMTTDQLRDWIVNGPSVKE